MPTSSDAEDGAIYYQDYCSEVEMRIKVCLAIAEDEVEIVLLITDGLIDRLNLGKLGERMACDLLYASPKAMLAMTNLATKL